MSIKIYHAWKVEINKLNEFIDFVRPQVLECARNIILDLMPHVSQEGIDKQKYEHPYYHKDDELRLECVLDSCRYVSNHSERCLNFDIDLILNIWLYKDYAYIIPVGAYRYFDAPEGIEEFRYWNNTNRPEELSEEEWDFRRETWNNINCGQGISAHNTRRLEHTIIDMSGIGDIDFELMMHKAIQENNNVNSS